MNKVYCNKNNKIVCTYIDASPEYWDEHWKKKITKDAVMSTPKSWVYRLTKKYLCKGSRVLEGGCGTGQYVFSLKINGYDVYGVDYAKDTVSSINSILPELKIEFGDINNLIFEDNYFDGYWSIGVIEHDWEGYESAAKEMYRVIKPGGYLFLSFPAISILRKFKLYLSLYEENFFLTSKPVNFYQYILDKNDVISNFEKQGFICVKSSWLGGFKGLKDECSFLFNFLNFINKSNNRLVRLLIFAFDIVIRSITGHSAILILKKISL